jgi:hypothetical protein
LKGEVFGKPLSISSKLLVEAFGRHPINRSEVAIENDLLAADGQNPDVRGFISPAVNSNGLSLSTHQRREDIDLVPVTCDHNL